MADEEYGPGGKRPHSGLDLDKDTSQGKMADVNRITDAINKELLDESKGSTIAQMIQFSIMLQYRKQIAERSGGEIEEGIQYRDYLLKIRDRFTNLQSLEPDEEVRLRAKAIAEIITDMNAMLPAIDDKLADQLRLSLEEFQSLIAIPQQDEGEQNLKALAESGPLPAHAPKGRIEPPVASEAGRVTAARMATSVDVSIYRDEPPARVQARQVLEQLPSAPQPPRLTPESDTVMDEPPPDFAEDDRSEWQAMEAVTAPSTPVANVQEPPPVVVAPPQLRQLSGDFEEGVEMELLPIPVPEAPVADFQGPPPSATVVPPTAEPIDLPPSLMPQSEAIVELNPEMVMDDLLKSSQEAQRIIADFQDPNDCSEQILRNQENRIIYYLTHITTKLSELEDNPHTILKAQNLIIDLLKVSEMVLNAPFTRGGKNMMDFFIRKMEKLGRVFEGEITDVKSIPLLPDDEFETVREEKLPWSPEKYSWLMEARKLIAKGTIKDEEEGMKILKEHGFVATERYDEIHQQETHNFSKKTLEEPNRFAQRFVKRTMREIDEDDKDKPLGKDSLVLDIGCGMGADSIHFAKQGATVIALDASPYAIDKLKRSLALYVKLGKTIEQFDTVDYTFDHSDNTVHLSDEGIEKLRRLMPPHCSEAIVEMNKLIKFYSKEFAHTKTKTTAPESLSYVDDNLKDNLILYPEWDEEKTREIMERTEKVTGVAGRIYPVVEEINHKTIGNLMSRQFTHVFENSSGHYNPPCMTKVLEGQKGTLIAARQGYYGKAMKTDKSASASVKGPNARNWALTMNDGYNFRIDKEDRIGRGFPTEDWINELIERTKVYKVLDQITITVDGYDRKNEAEEFRFSILKHLGAKKMI